MNFSEAITQTAVTRASLILIGLVQSIILARTLGPEGSGIYALLWLAVGLAGRFGNLGIGSSLAYFAARKQITLLQANFLIFIAVLICTSITIPPLMLIRPYDISPWHDISPNLFYLMLASIPFYFAGNFYQRLLSGYLRISQMNLANIIMSISMLLGMLIFLIWLKMGICGACFATLLSQVLFVIVQHVPIGESQQTTNRNTTENLNYSLKNNCEIFTAFIGYGIWNYLIMIGNFISAELPVYILKLFTGSNWEVGIFSRAQSFGTQSLTIIEPISANLFPFTACSSEETSKERTNRLCRILTLMLFLLAFILCLVIKPLVILLYGVEFTAAGAVFQALALGLFMRPIGYLTIIHLAASGKHKRALWPNIIAIAGGIIAGYILIPKWQALGAGFMVSIIISLQAICSVIEYKFQTKSTISNILFVRRSDLQSVYTAIISLIGRYKHKPL